MSTLAQILTEKAPGSAKWANGTITLFSLFLLATIFVSLQTFLIMVPVIYQHFVIQVASILLTHLYFACVSNKTFINRLTASMYSFYDFCIATFCASDREISRALHVGLFVLVVDVFLIALTPQLTLLLLMLPPLLGHVVYQLIWPFHHANFADHFCDDMPEHIAAPALLCMLCNDKDFSPYLPSQFKSATNQIDLIKQSPYETQKNFLLSVGHKLAGAHLWSNNEKKLYDDIINSGAELKLGLKELLDKYTDHSPSVISKMVDEKEGYSAQEIYESVKGIISNEDTDAKFREDLRMLTNKIDESCRLIHESLQRAQGQGDISEKYCSEKALPSAAIAIYHIADLLRSDLPLFYSNSEISNLIEYINKCRSTSQCTI